ncbi:MAG: 16S rRNA (uracil(1498)-N(3))-methyltransferase [Sphingobacteriales bacterium]|nr:MAG: 16S rRNA (uracil(1498)-N(3))-methyltransferase [Sphingobacteriales bacterium]
MALPLFYYDADLEAGKEIWLSEDTAKHIVQVLRMQVNDRIRLTNGRGYTAIVSIATAEKKKCKVIIEDVSFIPLKAHVFHLGIAFTKNASRNEWLLEKATELGVRTIIPLITKRTEREKTRFDRWNNILVSAMLQSQQSHLPVLAEATTLEKVLEQYNEPQKLVAHCIDEKERTPVTKMLNRDKGTILLIGPEGDFTEEEVTLCEAKGYMGISLGEQRLRTETAAMAACAYFNLINNA